MTVKGKILPNTTSSNLELFLLNIFKWVVITSMLALIAATVWLVGTGLWQLPLLTSVPPPAKAAPKPIFSNAEFFQAIKPQPSDKAVATPQAAVPSTLAPDTGEAEFRAQAERLWTYASKYQTDCKVAAPLSKSDFMESLRQTPLKHILESRGSEFAVSQDVFVKNILSSEDLVKLCKMGRTGLFFTVLEYHRSNWDRQVQDAKDFEARERDRIANFEETEANRVVASKARAYQAFLGAAISFGLFMGVALVLIFARLESNLRNLHSIYRTPEENSHS